jgi:hypothetical protein
MKLSEFLYFYVGGRLTIVWNNVCIVIFFMLFYCFNSERNNPEEMLYAYIKNCHTREFTGVWQSYFIASKASHTD